MTRNLSNNRRVVVTGLGVIASNGIGKDAFWDALQNGRSGISLITAFDPAEFTTQFAGEVRNFVPTDYIGVKQSKRMDRTSQFAVACAKMAVADAGINFNGEAAERTGVIIGTAMAGH
ncbi:MAG TPA: beta-ketoacyl-[acyl-carrier-protein] synthase II, partial [Prolixibacteraceae bacterium]|nr:beta-ketoacyl-[acyl-carrier-protein] synthase II [Prolixibacteraceae bacterium]